MKTGWRGFLVLVCRIFLGKEGSFFADSGEMRIVGVSENHACSVPFP